MVLPAVRRVFRRRITVLSRAKSLLAVDDWRILWIVRVKASAIDPAHPIVPISVRRICATLAPESCFGSRTVVVQETPISAAESAFR